MTDKYGRPLERPKNRQEADAWARKYASGELPRAEWIADQEARMEAQYNEEGPSDQDIAERVFKVYQDLINDAPETPLPFDIEG